jgi:hypothetical protein
MKPSAPVQFTHSDLYFLPVLLYTSWNYAASTFLSKEYELCAAPLGAAALLANLTFLHFSQNAKSTQYNCHPNAYTGYDRSTYADSNQFLHRLL